MKKAQFQNQSQSSDSEDEDPRLAYKKALKSQQQAQQVPQQQVLASKTFTKQMFEQRGLQYTEDDFQRVTSHSQKNNQKKPGGYVAGGAEANIEELKKELQVCIQKKDIKTACAVLQYILEKNISQKEKYQLSIQRFQYLLELNQYQDCVIASEKILNEFKDSQKDKQSQKYEINIRLILSKAKSYLGEIWSGYLEYLRAEGFCQSLMWQKQQEINKGQDKISEQDINWNESDNDLLLKELQDTELHFKAKLQQEKKAINFTYSSGFSNTGCLGIEGTNQCKILPILQFRNRQVLSVQCGDHHTIAVVKAFSLQHLYQPNYQQVSSTFDSSCEVFGWGQNTCGQITGDSSYKTIIEKPLLITELSGKQIVCVGAYKASSMAVDINGNVYEWGKNKYNQNDSSIIEKTFSIKKDVIQICRGNNLYVALDNKNNAFWWGSIKDYQLKKDQFEKINIEKVQNISAGANHIILCDQEGKTYGLGDNSKGQLSLDKTVSFAKQVQQLIQLKNYNIQKVQAYQNLSMFISKQGELLYTGEYQSDKIIQFVKEAEFSEENLKILTVSCSDNVIQAITQNGQIYVWETEVSVKFKQNKDTSNQTFRGVNMGQGFSIFTKSLPNVNMCTVQLKNDKKLETFSPIKIQVYLRDQIGPWGLKPFFPLRYQIMITDNKELNKQSCEKTAQQFSQLTKSKYTDEKIYIDEINGDNLLSFSVQQNQQELHIHELEIQYENSGKYYFWILLNEEMFPNMPLTLNIQSSELEKTKKEEQVQEEQKKLQEQLEKQRREEERRRKIEEAMQEELRNKELNEKKKKETEERAQEAYQKYLKDQQDKKIKEEEERKRRTEIQTGGGFNLDKLQQIQQQQELQKQQQPQKRNSSGIGVPLQKQPSKDQQQNLLQQNNKNAQQQPQTQQQIKRPSITKPGTGVGIGAIKKK